MLWNLPTHIIKLLCVEHKTHMLLIISLFVPLRGGHFAIIETATGAHFNWKHQVKDFLLCFKCMYGVFLCLVYMIVLCAHLSTKLQRMQSWRSNRLRFFALKIIIFPQKHFWRQIKEWRYWSQSCTLLKHLVNCSYLTTRFTSLYQPYWAGNYRKKNMFWYA